MQNRSKENNWSKWKLEFAYFYDRDNFIEVGTKAYNEVKQAVPTYRISWDTWRRNFDETNYYNQQLLQKGMDYFDTITSKIDMGGAFKRARLKVTDDKRGIFDFGLASLGLIKLQEYFSDELAKDSPNEFEKEPSGVVPFEFVRQKQVFDETQFWYKSHNTQKQYILTKQDKGTRGIQLNIPGAKKKYTTTNKKSYVITEKKGGMAKMVELYLPFHWTFDDEGMFIRLLPVLLVAKYMQQFQVKTRISVIRMYEEGNFKFVSYAYPVKDYGDEIDFNALAFNASQKSSWEMVRILIRAINDKRNIEGKKEPEKYANWSGQGAAAGRTGDYLDVFGRYKNWYNEGVKAGKLQPIRVDKKLMLIGGLTTVKYGIENNEELITEEFFRILDTVDFQFNKPQLVAKAIYKRMVSDKLDKWYQKTGMHITNPDEMTLKRKREEESLTTEFKQYCQQVLLDTYVYPEGGEYAESKEDADKMEKELDEKLKDLNQFLRTT